MQLSSIRKLTLLLVASLAIVIAALFLPQSKALKAETWLDRFSQYQIIPAHQRFVASTSTLAQASKHFCQNPQALDSYETLQKTWRASMSDWQSVNLFAFGPLKEDNLAWRLQFWPDKKNLVGKKAKALLRSNKNITADSLKEASVVLQGLSAVEYLVFDEGEQAHSTFHGEQGTRRCDLLVANASLIHATARELLSKWQGPYRVNFGGENADHEARLAELLQSISTALEILHKDKLSAPLGYLKPEGRANLYLSEAWRSEYSLSLIKVQLKALEHTTLNEQHSLSEYLNARDQQALSLRIRTQFETLNRTLENSKPDFSQSLEDPDQRQQLQRTEQEIKQLLDLLKNDVPKALNINFGFNDNDGD